MFMKALGFFQVVVPGRPSPAWTLIFSHLGRIPLLEREDRAKYVRSIWYQVLLF